MTNLYLVIECSAYFTSSVLICLQLWALKEISKGSNFSFLMCMISLLLLCNIAFIGYVAIYKRRRSAQDSAESNPVDELLIVSFSMSFDLIRYLTWQIMIWVFAFKYWVVSIEMPKAIQ